jgi:flavin reductase (DIM6/NTAB) family NADH-FMN oxidoreductase RutF/DNA-binding GntR family transcriptional regulator
MMSSLSAADSQPTLDPKEFRRVVGHLASGVTVVTTADGPTKYGMTASSVTSLSANPPMMLACLNNAVPTADAVARSGRYVVNVLGDAHGELAYKFASPSKDKFAGVDIRQGVLGLPMISDALAQIECEVSEQVVGGTHTVFLGRVVAATAGTGQPLTYYQGGFGRFEFARDDQVYRRARQQVLDRVYAAGEVLELTTVAQDLDVDETAAFYALTRLAGDGLVRRDPDVGYVVTPFDAKTSDMTFDARLAIEIGVIDQVVGKVETKDLDELRTKFEAMSAQLVDDRFVDFDSYLDANYQFHERLVALAGNPLLTATFGSLAIKQVMTRSFGSTSESSQRFIEAQRRITDAMERGHRDEAQAAVRDYTQLAKDRVKEILAVNGGLL